MYGVSQAFHDAVAAGNKQKALLIFDDCVFTDEDISVDRGIGFHDYFNMEDDLSVGQATSNEITFTLFNDERLLNDYEFGDFVATMGVLLDETTYQQFGSVLVNTKYAQYIGADNYPFLMRNGSMVPVQPSFAVKSMLSYGGRLYVFAEDGRYAVYRDATGENITGDYGVNDFMQKKAQGWAGKGIFYNKDSRILFVYEGGIKQRYEFCPLGEFYAERPNAPDTITLDFDCFDKMERFNQDMPGPGELGISYPISIGGLFGAMCRYVGVSYASDSFINSGAVITEEPEDFKNSTMREVIRWIAEAAGSNARFNRDGILEMAWLRETGQSYGTRNYSEFDPYWYATKPVTKLYNRDTQAIEDRTYGGGSECYVIQDNPLLRGVS